MNPWAEPAADLRSRRAREDPLCEASMEDLEYPPWPGGVPGNLAEWQHRSGFIDVLSPDDHPTCQLTNVNTIFPME